MELPVLSLRYFLALDLHDALSKVDICPYRVTHFGIAETRMKKELEEEKLFGGAGLEQLLQLFWRVYLRVRLGVGRPVAFAKELAYAIQLQD